MHKIIELCTLNNLNLIMEQEYGSPEPTKANEVKRKSLKQPTERAHIISADSSGQFVSLDSHYISPLNIIRFLFCAILN